MSSAINLTYLLKYSVSPGTKDEKDHNYSTTEAHGMKLTIMFQNLSTTSYNYNGSFL